MHRISGDLSCPSTARRRRESNPRTGLCRPLPKPLGHAAVWVGRPRKASPGIRRGGASSGRRDSNPRPSPWQGDALPAALRPQSASNSRTGDDSIRCVNSDPNRLPAQPIRSTAHRPRPPVPLGVPLLSITWSASARRCSSLGLRGHPRLGIVASHPALREALQARLTVGDDHHDRVEARPVRPSRRATARRTPRPRPGRRDPASSATRAPTRGCTIALRSARASASLNTILASAARSSRPFDDDAVAEARDDLVIAGRAGFDDLAGDRVGVDDHCTAFGQQTPPPCSCPTRLPRSAPPAPCDRTAWLVEWRRPLETKKRRPGPRSRAPLQRCSISDRRASPAAPRAPRPRRASHRSRSRTCRTRPRRTRR